MMHKKLTKCLLTGVSTAFISLVAPAAFAHDFWLYPDIYKAEPNQMIDVSVMIGHQSDRMNWPVDPHRVTAFRSIGPNGVQDHQAAVADYTKDKTLPIRLEAPGVHVITIETTHAFSELEADKFNAYLEEEGLLPIKVDRVLRNVEDQPGTEIYSRRGKALIQIGESSAPGFSSEHISLPVGLTLEIIPLDDPNSLTPKDMMRSQVLYRGVPVKDLSVGLINLGDEGGIMDLKTTDAGGFVEFKRPDAGRWMLHAVWSDALEDKSRADYDTVFSSLSFEIN